MPIWSWNNIHNDAINAIRYIIENTIEKKEPNDIMSPFEVLKNGDLRYKE